VQDGTLMAHVLADVVGTHAPMVVEQVVHQFSGPETPSAATLAVEKAQTVNSHCQEQADRLLEGEIQFSTDGLVKPNTKISNEHQVKPGV